MDSISNQMFSHDAEKWIIQPTNTQVNAPAPFDLDPSKGTRKTKDSETKQKKPRDRDPRFPQQKNETEENVA